MKLLERIFKKTLKIIYDPDNIFDKHAVVDCREILTKDHFIVKDISHPRKHP